jgi:nucleotide-binding universal stress UspA family protein
MRILLATDGSANSLHAASLIARWKHVESLSIDVLSVANVSAAQGPGEFDLGVDFAKGIEQQAQTAASKTAEILKAAGLSVQVHVVDGHPAATIVEKSKELKTDLVVIGAQGHTLLARLLLGSVSDFVATHSPCSVLVVRDTSFLDENRPLRICVGYDDSEPSKNAIEQLAKSGWGKDAHVAIVTALALPIDGFTDVPMQIDPQEIIAAYQTLVDKAVESAKQSVSPNVKGYVQRGNNVGLLLSDFVEQEKSDLVVVGDTGRGLVARFFLGSVSRSVLRHAPCSVWLVRRKAT